MRKLEKSVQYEILNLSLYGQTIENPKNIFFCLHNKGKKNIIRSLMFSNLKSC